MRMRIAAYVMFCAVLAVPWPTWAQDPPRWEFGLRGGINGSSLEGNYSAREIYLLSELPWSIPIKGLSALGLRLDAGIGDLKGNSEHGIWVAAGGDLFYRVLDDALELEVGWRPTWLSRYRFGEDDLGGRLQFSSHAGLAWHWERVSLGYRFQHTSNAGIYNENPGLNLHLLNIGFRF